MTQADIDAAYDRLRAKLEELQRDHAELQRRRMASVLSFKADRESLERLRAS